MSNPVILQPIPTHPLFEDLTGRVFNKMTVLGFVGKKGTHYHWWCRCECGNEKASGGQGLKSGAIKSCGCFSRADRVLGSWTHRNKAYQREYRKRNKERRVVKLREWRTENPSRTRYLNRNQRYRTRFGLTFDQVIEMAKSQDGLCAICSVELTLDRGASCLVVDHCHETGRVRGILCRRCNTGLGMFREERTFLEKAIRYLDNADGNAEGEVGLV